MKLALALGRTVAELREQMSNDEFVRWWAYFSIKAQREELAHLKAQGKSVVG